MPPLAVTRRLRSVATLLLMSAAGAAVLGFLAWHFIP